MADRKKTFTNQLGGQQFNPAMQFISTAPKTEPPKPVAPASGREPAPEGFRLNPMYIEKKSRRLQLLLQPSIYDAVKRRAEGEGVSVNDLINTILEDATK